MILRRLQAYCRQVQSLLIEFPSRLDPRPSPAAALHARASVELTVGQLRCERLQTLIALLTHETGLENPGESVERRLRYVETVRYSAPRLRELQDALESVLSALSALARAPSRPGDLDPGHVLYGAFWLSDQTAIYPFADSLQGKFRDAALSFRSRALRLEGDLGRRLGQIAIALWNLGQGPSESGVNDNRKAAMELLSRLEVDRPELRDSVDLVRRSVIADIGEGSRKGKR